MRKIRVLIIDDSALMRQILTSLLSSDPEIEVIGIAQDPYIARDKIKKLNPDVLTLDVEMPRMDGITFLEKLMAARPMPVVMVSSLTEAGCETTLRALELGAVDFFTKPKFDMKEGMEAQAEILVSKIKTAVRARVVKKRATGEISIAKIAPLVSSSMIKTTDTIIALGASTGGPEALRQVLEVLPPNTPPVILTLHMPEKFTKSFADRLNKICQIRVKEAEDGDSVMTGHCLVAPGGYHMVLVRSGARYQVRLNQEDKVQWQRPSVDVMFNSVAKCAGRNAVGVIFTGMGKDGAEGLLEMKRAGAYTIAQDEESCVVYGMPQEAVKTGAVDKILPLDKIPAAIIKKVESINSVKSSEKL
ncbi:MAG: chemotaxis response regulator protein-glutamate methylesterase [Nitrospirae bacterium]|nr:chemotaxis response regulator protein-glutamate methylesterase [Nitrospirota bacterium]